MPSGNGDTFKSLASRSRLRERSVAPCESLGVAEDLQYSTDETEMLYLPYVNQPTNPLIVLARGQRSAEALTPLLRQVIQEVDGQVPVFEAKTMTEHLGIAFFIPRQLGISPLGFWIGRYHVGRRRPVWSDRLLGGKP